MDIALLVAASASAVGVDWPGDFTMTARRPARVARGPPCRAVRLHRRRDREAGAVRRRAARTSSASPRFSTPPRPKAASTASASTACGCTSAGPEIDRRGGGGDRAFDFVSGDSPGRRRGEGTHRHFGSRIEDCQRPTGTLGSGARRDRFSRVGASAGAKPWRSSRSRDRNLGDRHAPVWKIDDSPLPLGLLPPRRASRGRRAVTAHFRAGGFDRVWHVRVSLFRSTEQT